MRWISAAMFVAVLWISADAQQDPQAFISVGRELLPLTGQQLWKLETNVNVSAGCRFTSDLLAIAYFDYNVYTFQGTHHDDPHSPGNYYLTSLLIGVKASMTIPRNLVSPYFLGVVGVSRGKSAQDSVITFQWPEPVVVHRISGNTVTFLAAGGCDISIYKGLFAFVEVRASAGLKTQISNILIMYRGGIGIAFY